MFQIPISKLDESSSDDDFHPECVNETANYAEKLLLPESSKHKYTKVYDDFVAWKRKNKVNGDTDENVIVEYFHELSTKYKPTSLWAYFSMLKATMKSNHNIDISHPRLMSFLKSTSVGYEPVKAKIFTVQEINKFIADAPDKQWLDVKVVCIFAISGGLRTDELTRIEVKDVEQHGELLLVRILPTKTNPPRSFTISGKLYDVVRKYAALRSPKTTDDRFFVNYRDGKCTMQVMGKNKFAKMAERVASFLMLPEPHRYTGHSYKRSSTTILANAERLESVEVLKRLGESRSSELADEQTLPITLDRDVDGCRFEIVKLVSDDSQMNFCDMEDLASGYDPDKVKLETEFIISHIGEEAIDESTCNSYSNTGNFDMDVGYSENRSDKSAPEREKYQRVYDDFAAWKRKHQVTGNDADENVTMKYFYELSTKLKPTSLWAYFSMLKFTMKLHHNIDISCHRLTSFLKTKSQGYEPTTAKVFTMQQIEKFISDAPDKYWLDVKVVCIFGISGGLRTTELTKIKVDDVEQHGDLLLVRILATKPPRSFTISGKLYDVVRKYAALRSPKTTDRRFFVNYRYEKCTMQVMGKNKFAKMAERVATFLMLPDPHRYTGHSFRRSTATILAKAKSIERVAWHGGERSNEEHTQQIVSDRNVDGCSSEIVNVESDDSEMNFCDMEDLASGYDPDKVKLEAEFIISDSGEEEIDESPSNSHSNTGNFDIGDVGDSENRSDKSPPAHRPEILQSDIDHSISPPAGCNPVTDTHDSQLGRIISPKSGRRLQYAAKISHARMEKRVQRYRSKVKMQASSIDALRRQMRAKNRQIAKLRSLLRRDDRELREG